MPWPIYFAKNLTLGSERSTVGIATLWTEKEQILNSLKKDDFHIGGQLYSKTGINFIIRNILAKPVIRKLVLCGQDEIGSGEALLNLLKNGIDEKHQIIGSEHAVIHKEIPREWIETFRKNVEIIDMRKNLDLEKIQQLNSEGKNAIPFCKKQLFPDAQPEQVEFFPSEMIGMRIEAETVAICWLKVLQHIMRFGYVRPSHYSQRQKELINLNTVITSENPENPFLAPWFTFTQQDFFHYLPQILTGDSIEGVNYTYGERLREHFAIDQIQESILRRLKTENFSRRAVAVTWDPKIDSTNEHCPCLDLVQCLVQENKLFFICYMRSNDMYRAYPLNALAFRTLQKQIADEVGLELGYLNIISASAHVYDENFREIQELLEKYSNSIPSCQWDPRGNYIIEIQNEMLSVTHYSPEGRELDRIEGKTAREVYRQIAEKLGVSLIPHAFDLGAQLQNAETALKLGIPFRQDMVLEFQNPKLK